MLKLFGVIVLEKIKINPLHFENEQNINGCVVKSRARIEYYITRNRIFSYPEISRKMGLWQVEQCYSSFFAKFFWHI